MPIKNPHKQSKSVLDHLRKQGMSSEVQQRIGAFIVVWGMFETNLEVALWALCDEEVAGVRPSTDKTRVGQWIDILANGSPKFNPEIQDLLRITALTAKDLMEYRHAIVHGWLMWGTTFIRNPRWHGEVSNRTSSDAHVDENLLDIALDAAWTIYRVVYVTRIICANSGLPENLLTLKPDVIRAQSISSELRNLTELMNHEKY